MDKTSVFVYAFVVRYDQGNSRRKTARLLIFPEIMTTAERLKRYISRAIPERQVGMARRRLSEAAKNRLSLASAEVASRTHTHGPQPVCSSLRGPPVD